MSMITEQQVGILSKNGRFQKVLTAGKYYYPQILGYQLEIIEASGLVQPQSVPLAILAKDPNFCRLTAMVEITDTTLAAHYKDGRLSEIIYTSGRYYYWNILQEHSFLLIDLTTPDIAQEVPLSLFDHINKQFFIEINLAEGEGALVYFDNKLERLLTNGRYYFWNYLTKVTYKIITMNSPFISCVSQGLEAELLADYPAIAEKLAVIDVPDGNIMLHYVNGRLLDALPSGWYGYWQTSGDHTFRLLDITDAESANTLGDESETIFRVVDKKWYDRYDVASGEVGLLYRDNVLIKTLPSGRYYFWRYREKITLEIYDLRLQPLDITGQEILTNDKVTVRLNFTCTYRIDDPVALASGLQNYASQLYTFVQLVLREYIGQYKLDELLAQKEQIASKVLALLQEQNKFALTFVSAGLKDIILPGDVREIMNTVLLAEKKAQANVITRREEVASTRSLLNTAKLMDENHTLYKLKELEYLERICDSVGSISVSGGGDLLGQLERLLVSKKTEE